MARIRTIKPEFWTSEKIVECSTIARLLFVGMWNFCDDRGVHKKSAKRLKMEVFPGDEITLVEIEGLIQELVTHDLIMEFTNEGKQYWHVIGWKQHQRIDRPTKSNNPEPPESNSRELPNSGEIHRILVEDSTSPRDGREGKGKEGKGRDIICNVELEEKTDLKKQERWELVETIFCYWKTIMGKKRSQLLSPRRRAIKNALNNYGPEYLKKAIDGCSKSAFHMGNNDEKKLYNDIELIFRVTQKQNNIEKFSEYCTTETPEIFEDKLKTLFD